MSAIDDLARDVREEVSRELHDELAAQGALASGQEGSNGAREFLSGGMGKLAMCVGVPLLLIGVMDAIAFHHLDLVAAAPDAAAAQAAVSDARWTIFLTTGLFAFLLGAGGFYLLRDVVQVARRLADTMEQISFGKTDLTVADQHRSDEFGEMARSVEIMRRGTKRLLRLTQKEKQSKAERDELRISQEREVLELAEHFDRTVAEVVSGVAAASTQLHATASEMSRAAEQSTDQSEKVASSMEQAAQGASAAAAASDEFAMSIGEISRQAADSAELARKARGTADEADQTMSTLDEAANAIGQVVELISTIASRTNLLALNASIEAARGGEAGRGFAVVASEVKELASQTSKATQDVADQIQAIQSSTGNSVKALRTVSKEIQQIEATAIAIASAVDQQSVAGQDLARSIDVAARHSEEVGTHVRDVRENSLRTGAAASQVLNSASELERQASTLREQVDAFLVKIRSRSN